MTAASSRLLSRPSRFLSTASMLLALALSACGGASTESSPDPIPTQEEAPSTVPDRVFQVVEAGAGDTTVVFESGLGDGWTPWKKVTSEVAAQARTFAYSRPGYGTSEPSPEPRDASHIVADLRALLASRGYAPPYVLVGHSFGGAYMELFAKAHPEEVTGVVLVDPRHRDFLAACDDAGLDGCAIPDAVVATLPQVERDEYEAYARVSEEIGAVGGFGSYPVRVLTATAHGGFTPEVETLWQSQHASLADEAADGEQTLFVGAGHYLHMTRAHEVAEVILSLVPAPEG